MSVKQKHLTEQLTGLYTMHVDMVYRIAMMYMKEPAAAEDAVQDVFVKLMEWLARGHFEDGEHVKHWLIATTKNTCLDELRRQKRHRTEPLEHEDGTDAVKVGNVRAVWQQGQGPEGERLRQVHEALMDLPEKYRLVVYLFYFEGYSSAEIAEMLHVNHGTVRSRLRIARRRMKLLLEEDEE